MQIFFKKLRNITSLLIIVGCLVSCEDIFQYSPYDAEVDDNNVNRKNIEKINTSGITDTLWFVAIADVHHWYDELADAIEKINTLKNIRFIVVCGDITDAGFAKEFNWYNHLMKNSDVPYITIIGNHDYRSNGKVIYEKLFGESNFTFDQENYRFIGFDDIVWENGNRRPDFEWLNYSLSDTSHSMQVVFAHIPPWGDQINIDSSEMVNIITKMPKHVLVMHGHDHKYYCTSLHAQHVVTGSIKDRNLCMIGLCDSTFVLQQIGF